MCGRYTLTRQEQVAEAFSAALGEIAQSQWWKPRFNIAPTQPAPVVSLRAGAAAIELMKWGLVPHWAGRAAGSAPAAKRPPLMINARVETLAEKPVFRDALARRRCLVPATGFYEWQRAGQPAKAPVPLYFHPGTDDVVAFAGLWARAHTDAGEQLSFTIITGAANLLVAPVHDRMPVVLDPSVYAAWLDPATDGHAARALLAQPPVGDWRADPVSTYVNKVDHDDARCIELAPPEPSAQLSLL